MRKIDQKQKQRQSGGSTNGFIPNSFRSISSYLRIVSSGASTVASTVRSAASAASTIVDRDTDVVPDQVLWAGFDNLECEGDVTCRVLLLGYQYGFQVWDVEDANNVRNIVSRYDGAVFSMQILPKPVVSTHSRVEYVDDHPLLVICADGSFSAGGNAQGGPAMIKNTRDQVNGGSVPTVVWFYSLKSQSYIKELKFRSVVYSVRCSSRVVAVLQAAQVHCFDVATLQREYTILTNPIVTSSSWFDYMGLGPLAVGPRWVAYSGNVVALPNTRVTPQQLTHSRTFTTPGSNGSIVAHYAKQSSKQLAVGIVTLGDIGYKKLSRYYSEFLPDGSISQQVSDPSRKDHGTPNGRLPDTENVGMVIVRDVVSKSVIAQFKAHDSPIASLCFDPSGTLLVTASVHGHNFNVFRIMPGVENGASYIHLYRLQRGFTNAVIRDISFSVDSRWITISSSRGTSHLFAISPSGGPINIQSAEESLTTNQGYNYDATNKPPITLSAISRIRSGNSGWRNVVTGAAVAASGRTNTYSGVIVSTFHKCKDNNMGADLGSRKSKYHMLVFSSSGYVIQYALQVSSEVDTAYNSSPDHDSRLTVEPIQKWNICNKQNRREREENVDIYGENGHTVNRKVFPERTENESIDYFDGISKVKRDNVSLEERNHVYISEVELQMHQSQIPLWARAQINFHSLTIDDVTKDGGNYLKGEIEIEKIQTHTVEARSRYLVPAIDHFQRPRVQMTRVPALDYNGSESIPHQTFRLYEHEKLSNGSTYEHEKLSNGSPYEHEKLSNGSPYEHEKLYNGNIYEHEKLSTGSNYDHEKLFTGSNFNHDKLSNGSSFNHDELSNGSSFNHDKLSNGSSYEHEKLSNGSSYEHEKLTNGSTYEQEKLSNGSSYEHERLSNGSSLCPIYRTTDTIVSNGGFEIGDEETGEDARQMPVEDTNGFVNNDSNLISQTQPETVDNREHSVSDTQSELVNNNIGQKLENQFEDQGDEFD